MQPAPSLGALRLRRRRGTFANFAVNPTPTHVCWPFAPEKHEPGRPVSHTQARPSPGPRHARQPAAHQLPNKPHHQTSLTQPRLPAQPATTQASSSTNRPVYWLHDSLPVLCIALPLPRGFLISWSNDARTCPCLNRHLTSSAACSRTTDAARLAGPRRATRSNYKHIYDYIQIQ